jgi:hypothetical protein
MARWCRGKSPCGNPARGAFGLSLRAPNRVAARETWEEKVKSLGEHIERVKAKKPRPLSAFCAPLPHLWGRCGLSERFHRKI